MAPRHQNSNWWEKMTPGIGPLMDGSTLQSSDFAADAIGATNLDTTTKSYIPGVATIDLSSKSSNDEYNARIVLYDIGGNAWTRREHVRVFLGTTAQDGTVASTAWSAFGIKSSASTDVFSTISTINTGVEMSTQQATLDKDFLTASDGLLSVAFGKGGAHTASTLYLMVDWRGGLIVSSGTVGTTVAAT